MAIIIHGVCFAMMQSLSGDPALKIAAGRYGPDGLTSEIAQSVKLELGLDRPIFEQYVGSLLFLLQFDLGYSLISGERIMDEIKIQLGYTLYLAIMAFVFSIVIAVPLGIYCGAKQNGFIDQCSLLFSVFVRAIPPFVLGLLFILIFSVYFQILPPAGFEDWTYFVLPASTLAFVLLAMSSRLIRNSMVEVSRTSYYHYGRHKGLSDFALIQRHGVKNTFIPIIAFFGLQAIFLIEGVVIVESVFAFPGIGHALVHAVIARDVPMIQGSVIIIGWLFIAINFLADALARVLDKRLAFSV